MAQNVLILIENINNNACKSLNLYACIITRFCSHFSAVVFLQFFTLINFLLGLSGGVIGGMVITSLLLLAVIGQFLVVLLFFVYKTKGDRVSNNYDISSLFN